MAEVRSKMADVKSQVMEARESGEPRPGPSGGFGLEEVSAHSSGPELPACHKGGGELEVVGRAAVARSRACRPGKHRVRKNSTYLKMSEKMSESIYTLEGSDGILKHGGRLSESCSRHKLHDVYG